MVRTAPIRAIRAICVRTPHKKRANTRFAPTRHNIIQLLMVNCQLSCRVHGTYCVHSRDLRNLRSDNPTPHKKRANTRFAPTLTTLITVDYFSLFTFHSSLFTFHFIRILVTRSPTRTTYTPEDSGRTWSPAEAFIVRTSEPTTLYICTVSALGRVRRSAPPAA